MNTSLVGPSTTDTITGGKTLELTEYDKHRKPHKVINDGTMVTIGARTLSSEICCPICLDLFTATMGTKECLHRFCSECINTALLRNNKECPTCRKKIVSKRSLRADTNLDALLSKIWPERKLYDEMQAEADNYYHIHNSVASLQKSIEAGIKAQAQNRRQRVQGSYDYEKRKRKRRQPDGEQAEETQPNSPSDATPPINGENGDTAEAAASNDESSSFDSSTTESSSDISSTTSSDLDSISSDEDANDPRQTSAPPSLENMMASSMSPAEESTPEMDRASYSVRLAKLKEVEVELAPSMHLRQRADVACTLKRNRFIRTHHNTTMEHLSEFLLQVARAELLDLEAKGQPVHGSVPTPTFFFAFDTDRRLYTVPLTEILRQVNESAPASSEHLRVYFDTDGHNEARLEQFVLANASTGGAFEDEAMSDD